MKDKAKLWCVIPAAGTGRRLGSSIPKQYLHIMGKPVIQWTLEKLDQLSGIEAFVVAIGAQDSLFDAIEFTTSAPVSTVQGGQERYDSVLCALNTLSGHADKHDWVLVHDAVRPCVDVHDLIKLMNELTDSDTGGILAAKVKETLKSSVNGQYVKETLDRRNCWLAQTPQVFRYEILLDAMQKAKSWPDKVTDEASAVELAGYKVQLVEGKSDNIKITNKSDLKLAEYLLSQEPIK